jgi:hypothetical protein
MRLLVYEVFVMRLVTKEFLRLVRVDHIIDVTDTSISHHHHITHLMILIIDKVIITQTISFNIVNMLFNILLFNNIFILHLTFFKF